MKMPIPNDWDETTWQCFQIVWPDSPKWIALLMGFLSQPSHGYFWDERSGSILGVQEIGREIFGRNVPLIDCEGVEIAPDETLSAIYAACDIESECEMGCSIPYGSLRYEGGKLQYLYCGVWYDVEGQSGLTDWEGNEPETELPTEYTDNSSACAKALAWTDVVFGVVDKALDMAALDTSPFDFMGQLRAIYPNIAFGTLALANVFAAALNIVIQGKASETEAPLVQQMMRCRVRDAMPNVLRGVTPDEYEALKSAIRSVATSQFTILQHPTAYGFMSTIYDYASRAIGAMDSANITAYAQPQEGKNCECPASDAYFGTVRFTTDYTWGTHTGVTFQKEPTLYNNGKVVRYELKKDTNNYREARDLVIPIVGMGDGDDITIRVRPYSGIGLPTQEWVAVANTPVYNPALWMTLFAKYTGTPAPTSLAATGSAERQWSFTVEPGATITGVEVDARFAPDNPAIANQVYYVEYEIIAVNGVPV